MGNSLYARFGLTDTITAELAAEHLVITDDLPLWSLLTSIGRDAININHLRL